MVRRWLSVAMLAVLVSSARAGQNTRWVEIPPHRIEVKITENFARASTVRAECLVPAPHRVVWQVLSDYDNLDVMVPAVSESKIVGERDGQKLLWQKGRAGLWFIKRGFEITFRVKEIPMSYIGFEAVEGDFQRFVGSWQVEERDGGTWVSHKVEIEPAFYAPKWAIRNVARRLMSETIEGVLQRCLSADIDNATSASPSPTTAPAR